MDSRAHVNDHDGEKCFLGALPAAEATRRFHANMALPCVVGEALCRQWCEESVSREGGDRETERLVHSSVIDMMY